VSSARVGLALLALAAVVVNVWAARRLDRDAEPGSGGEELLYLPSGKHLELASLGQASLVADAIYLWAIQYYANYGREDRYRWVEHVFGEVIAELDPHYVDAYWLGALILSVEARDLEAALRLLDRGAAANPEAWVLPYVAGWECAHAGDYARAEAYFERARLVPGAPAVVRRLVAGMIDRAGDARRALAAWKELRADPRSDAATLAIAQRQIRELQVRVDLADLRAALDRFRIENQRFPSGLEELVRRAYIASVPRDPSGASYVYDPGTGRVSSSAGRILGDS
jgi:tetratricopeptide (TPR) repeat protein